MAAASPEPEQVTYLLPRRWPFPTGSEVVSGWQNSQSVGRMLLEDSIMLELTKEQCHELKKENGESVRILDPETHQEYVLVRAVLFDRLKSLLAIDEEKEFANEIYPQVMEVFAREG